MMTMKKVFIFFFISSLVWAGCNPTKYVPAHDKLYTGATLNIKGAASVRQRKVLDEDLEGLTRPKPNSRFLGIPFKLYIYNMFHGAKKGFFKSLRTKYGEPPVLLSQVDLEQNVKVLQGHLQNKGYFQALVTADTIVKRKTAKAKYNITAGEQYTINSVNFPHDSSVLSQTILQDTVHTLLTKGSPFDLDVIKGERTRIDAWTKEKGFYFMSPDYLIVKTDSTIGNHKVNMYVDVKPEAPQGAREIWRINDVYIYSGYSLNTAAIDTMKTYAKDYKGFDIIDRKNRFKPRLFEETMQFKPGDIYNRTDHNRTLSRLINLNVFKFVNNRFEVTPADSPKLNAYYYLTPMPTQSLQAQALAISRSNNLNGTQFNLSWTDRNLFRNATQVHLTAYLGSDVQFSGAFSGYNTYRTGAEADFVMPRIQVPFVHFRDSSRFAPRTTLRLGYDILQRSRLFTLNSYRFEYGYTWKKSLEIQNELYPISISYVQPLSVTPAYIKLEDSIPGLSRTTRQQFILGSRYEFLFNQLANQIQHTNSFYFDGNIDLSGNIAGLVTGANVKKGDTVRIAGSPFSQYVKFEADGRYYRKVGLHSTWANRIDIGVGIPYGNSVEVPYVKQFFVGGNNSLRGFRSRGVGPGIFYPMNTAILPDETGDIKLEMNSEYRPHISGPLYGALFIDAGNIWLYNDSTYTNQPGGQFTSHFLSQLAVDAGVGIRFDITIFVIRFDVAFPLRKPWLQNPWVLQQIALGNSAWRRNNLVFNLGIGYPF